MKYDTPRLRAKAAGLKRYEGLPCPNCNGTTRLVSNQQCIPCKQAKKYAARKKKQKYGKRGRPAKEKVPLTPEQVEAKKAYARAYNKEYRHRPENKGYSRAKRAKRRCAEIQRNPIWVTKEDRKAMKQIYKQAITLSEKTGIPHQVDHILPLRGKLVSGLHVLSNLQILPALENQQKSASFSP